MSVQEIRYYYDLNKISWYDLDNHLSKIINTNRRKLLYDSIILASWENQSCLYRIFIDMNSELKLCMKLYRDDNFISTEFFDNSTLEGCGMAFMYLLFTLKDIVKAQSKMKVRSRTAC